MLSATAHQLWTAVVQSCTLGSNSGRKLIQISLILNPSCKRSLPRLFVHWFVQSYRARRPSFCVVRLNQSSATSSEGRFWRTRIRVKVRLIRGASLINWRPWIVLRGQVCSRGRTLKSTHTHTYTHRLTLLIFLLKLSATCWPASIGMHNTIDTTSTSTASIRLDHLLSGVVRRFANYFSFLLKTHNKIDLTKSVG